METASAISACSNRGGCLVSQGLSWRQNTQPRLGNTHTHTSFPALWTHLDTKTERRNVHIHLNHTSEPDNMCLFVWNMQKFRSLWRSSQLKLSQNIPVSTNWTWKRVRRLIQLMSRWDAGVWAGQVPMGAWLKKLGRPRPGCTDGRQTTHTQGEGQGNSRRTKGKDTHTHTLHVRVCFMMMIMVDQPVLETHTSPSLYINIISGCLFQSPRKQAALFFDGRFSHIDSTFSRRSINLKCSRGEVREREKCVLLHTNSAVFVLSESVWSRPESLLGCVLQIKSDLFIIFINDCKHKQNSWFRKSSSVRDCLKLNKCPLFFLVVFCQTFLSSHLQLPCQQPLCHCQIVWDCIPCMQGEGT